MWWGPQDEPEAVRAVLELVAAGKVRHGGISNHRAKEIERALGVIVWSPLASGFLTDGFSLDPLDERDFRRTHPFAQLALDNVRASLRGDGRTVCA